MAGDLELYVSEVFSAIQGEGLNVGERQVFLRLAGCNIRCSYCDQPEALERRARPCLVEIHPGKRDWESATSPALQDEVAAWVDRLWSALSHQMVSVTGGEPLMQARALSELAGELVSRGHRIALETNGTLPGRLALVISKLSHLSMDVKLDSVDGQGADLSSAIECLEMAREEAAKRPSELSACAKIVLGSHTDVSELASAVGAIHGIWPDLCIFLQPVTPFGKVTSAPSPLQVLELQELCLRQHARVRVLPQTHKMIGQR